MQDKMTAKLDEETTKQMIKRQHFLVYHLSPIEYARTIKRHNRRNRKKGGRK